MSTKKKVLLGIVVFLVLGVIISCSIWFGTTKQRHVTEEFFSKLFDPETTTDELVNKYMISGIEKSKFRHNLIEQDGIKNMELAISAYRKVIDNDPLKPQIEKIAIRSISVETGKPTIIGGFLRIKSADSEYQDKLPFEASVLKIEDHFNVVHFKLGTAVK